MTDYSKLLDAGHIKPGRFARQQVMDCLTIAGRDLDTAASLIESGPEWAFNIAYDAMHQAGRAFLFHAGYRTAGEGHHATVVRFLEIGLDREHEALVMILDRMRRKRNRATYDVIGTIARNEATEAIAAAREFVAVIARQVRTEAD